ncbi:uncharacterized protein LOC109527306 isoform X3 [Hippocampus comes]|uniref:uncharacterized protein LOC109527306 isoform X3 n=1 Tax=Hippocampus comes TaxID=109280 RepID=UPI00094E0FA6|nr:PREDICTED: uncharacterized protein LOC109527306 isoform X3 [Hippocampus comes]
MNPQDSSDPPQLPSLGIRKTPCDKMFSTDVDHTFLQQMSIVISVQDQAAAQSSLTKPDVIPDKKVDESSVDDIVIKQQEATVTHPISDFQRQISPLSDDSKSTKDKEEEKMTKCERTLSQTCTQLTSDKADQSCSTAFEDQQRTKNNLQSDLVRNQKVSPPAPCSECMGNSKDDKVESVTEEPAKKRKRMDPREEEVLHSSQDNATDRPKTAIHMPEEGSVLAPDPTLSNSNPPVMEKEYCLENPNPQEVDCGSSRLTSCDVEVQYVAITPDEKMQDVCGDAVDCEEDKADALSVRTQEGDCSAKLCEAAPSGVSETNDMPGHDNQHCSGAVNTEHPSTMSPDDFLGSGCFDFVSDSQLYNIQLIEEQEIKEKVVEPSGREEDASVLICGLIKELSFLNRTVMAARREIEHLRRGSKKSRNLAR